MRIVTTVKFVPDLQSTRSFTDGRVTRVGEDGTMNELDENAVEAALQLKEAAGEGEVYALTIGGPDAVAAVRKALQLGVDHAIHVSDEAIVGSDAVATARVIAAAVRAIAAESGPIDMVITGMAALDTLTSLVPTALAAELGWAGLSLASSLEVADGAATIVRHLPDEHVTMRAALPAVVSVTDEANSPRYPNFKLIMAARKAPVTTWTLADIGVDPASVGQAAAKVTVLDASERPPRDNRQVVTDTGEGGKALADFLIERGLA